MKALVFTNQLEIQDVAVPEPASDEALIKIILAGICNTDIEITRGYMDFRGIPGHEFVGVVEASQQKQWIGKRVVGEININCHQCAYCKEGKGNHCPNRSVLGISGKDGVFTEYVTLPVRNLHEVPEEIQDEEAVFVEPLAAACRIVEQIDLGQYDCAAVIGDGKLGLLIALTLKQTGCPVVLYGKHDDKMSILPRDIKTIKTGSDTKQKYDLVVEASGSSAGFHTALDLIKPAGTLILKSTMHDVIQMPSAKLVVDEIVLIGSRCGPFREAINLLSNHKVDVKPLITGIWPLSQALEAFSIAQGSASLKVLLNPSE